MVAEYGPGDQYYPHPDSAKGRWTESRVVSASVLLEEAEEGGRFRFPPSPRAVSGPRGLRRESTAAGDVEMGVGDMVVFDAEMVTRGDAGHEGAGVGRSFSGCARCDACCRPADNRRKALNPWDIRSPARRIPIPDRTSRVHRYRARFRDLLILIRALLIRIPDHRSLPAR